MKTADYKPHVFALFALFVCGNAVITLPFFNASNPLLCFFVTAVASIIFILFFYYIINLCFKFRIVFIVIGLAVSGLAIYSTVTTLYDYLGFVADIQLPQTSVVLLWLMALLTVTVFASSSNSAIYKYGLLVAIFSVGMIILMFLGQIKHFDISQIKSDLSKSDFFTTVPKMFLRYFSSLAVPVLFVALTNNKKVPTTIVYGAACGFLIIAVCLAQSVLTLGASPTLYPYIRAVSVISSGSLFTRYDGFVYFVFFACAITKAAVCVKTVILVIQSIKNPHRYVEL